MPRPQRRGEAYLVGLVLPADESLRNDPQRARAAAEMFVLNRGSTETGRTTDLCGWRADGKELTYNIGAPPSVEGFHARVQEKLNELGR